MGWQECSECRMCSASLWHRKQCRERHDAEEDRMLSDMAYKKYVDDMQAGLLDSFVPPEKCNNCEEGCSGMLGWMYAPNETVAEDFKCEDVKKLAKGKEF